MTGRLHPVPLRLEALLPLILHRSQTSSAMDVRCPDSEKGGTPLPSISDDEYDTYPTICTSFTESIPTLAWLYLTYHIGPFSNLFRWFHCITTCTQYGLLFMPEKCVY